MKLARNGLCLALVVGVASLACGRARKQPVVQRIQETPLPAAIEPALVRVLHAVPGGKPLDVFVGDHVAFASVKYKAVTDYQPLEATRALLRFRLAGEDTSIPLLEGSTVLAVHEHYTLVIMSGGDGKRLQLDILNDDVDPPATGKTRIRVVNAAPEVDKLKVVLGARKDAIATGVEARSATGYSEIDPLSGTLELRDESLKRTLAKLPDWHLDPGKSYTLYVLGRSTGQPGIEPFIIQDEVPTAAGG